MAEINLFDYYNLDECIDKKSVMNKLKSFKNDGKIEYNIDNDVLKLIDIDLEDSDIEKLVTIFDKNDIFPYLDYEEQSGDEDYGGEDYDSDEQY